MRRHPDFLAGIYGCGYTIIAIIIVITIVIIIIPVRDGLYKFAEGRQSFCHGETKTHQMVAGSCNDTENRNDGNKD